MRTIPLLHDLMSKVKNRQYKVYYVSKVGAHMSTSVYTSTMTKAKEVVKGLGAFLRFEKAPKEDR